MLFKLHFRLSVILSLQHNLHSLCYQTVKCSPRQQFLAAKNAQDFLSWIWTGDYCKTTNTNVTWLLLNIWATFETVLFPLVFAILYIYQKIHKNSRHDQGKKTYSDH